MKKVFLLFMIITGFCFAGNFEKRCDTTSHARWVGGYEYVYPEDDLVEPTPTVVIYTRTAPRHCVNPNCQEKQKYNHKHKKPKHKQKHAKVIRK